MVEGGQLADDGQDGVGMAEVVGGHAGQVLDLAHHVVTQVTDQTGVKGGQVRKVGGLESVEHGIEGGQDAGCPAHPVAGDGVQVQGPVGGHPGAAGGDGGQRITTDEGVAPPPLTALDRLEEEAGAVGPVDNMEEGGHRGDGVGHQLAPYRHDAVLGRQ